MRFIDPWNPSIVIDGVKFEGPVVSPADVPKEAGWYAALDFVADDRFVVIECGRASDMHGKTVEEGKRGVWEGLSKGCWLLAYLVAPRHRTAQMALWRKIRHLETGTASMERGPAGGQFTTGIPVSPYYLDRDFPEYQQGARYALQELDGAKDMLFASDEAMLRFVEEHGMWIVREDVLHTLHGLLPYRSSMNLHSLPDWLDD